MKKAAILVILLVSSLFLNANAQEKANKPILNDYSMLGVNYGVSFSMFRIMHKQKPQELVFNPQYISVMYTNYGKFFGRYPNFGIQFGVAYGSEGYRLKSIDEHAEIKTIEVPVLAQFHADFSHLKLIANLGMYGGYRNKINYKDTDTTGVEIKFNKFDFGAQGGVGFAIVFDPVEIQFNGLVRFSMSTLYPPSTFSQTDYTYSYPLDFIVSAGLHFHLERRYGKTNRQLKQEAREAIMQEYEDSKSIDR